VVFLGRRKLRTRPLKISQPPNISIIFGGFKVGPPKTNGSSEVVNYFLLPPSPRPTTAPYSLHTYRHLPQVVARSTAALPGSARQPPPPSCARSPAASPGHARQPSPLGHARQPPPPACRLARSCPSPAAGLITERAATLRHPPAQPLAVLPVAGLAPTWPAPRSCRRPPSPPRR
jgi:hypothetical protein